MEYCGVRYVTARAGGGAIWNWRILDASNGSIRISGQADSQETAVRHAHEAIGEAVRADSHVSRDKSLPHLADQALHILHGARSIAPTEAIKALRPFVLAMRGQLFKDDHLADASSKAMDRLVDSLKAQRVASDDVWETAIETTLSFANGLSQIDVHSR